jgi:SAM-dependent methyltransferase
MTTLPPAKFKDHFSGVAEVYAASRPSYPPALAAALAKLCAHTSVAVDCGCGNGQLSTILAAHFEQVIALDPSAAQIAAAAPHPRVAYRVAPAEHTGVADHSANLVVAAQAAHWFDLPEFWREVRRIARPGAPCALITYSLMQVEPAIDDCVRHFHDVTLGDYWPPERASVIAGYRDIAFPFAELAMPSLHIERDWNLEQLMNYLDTWSGLKAAEKVLPVSPRGAFRDQLGPLWGDPAMRRAVRWPLTVRCGRVS